jgi:hypothetical protein
LLNIFDLCIHLEFIANDYRKCALSRRKNRCIRSYRRNHWRRSDVCGHERCHAFHRYGSKLLRHHSRNDYRSALFECDGDRNGTTLPDQHRNRWDLWASSRHCQAIPGNRLRQRNCIWLGSRIGSIYGAVFAGRTYINASKKWPICLSCNSKKALMKGTIVSIATALSYLLIVILTTPSLPPANAIGTALAINSFILFSTATGIGAQTFISSYGKGLGCLMKRKKELVAAGSSGTAFSSFLSFFSLVPLGCCGSWLFILSFLPSIFGTALSVALIQYSTLLSYVGLSIIFGFAGLQALRLREEMKQRDGVGRKMPPHNGGL